MVTRVIRGVEADGSLGFARCALSLSGLCTKYDVPNDMLAVFNPSCAYLFATWHDY